MLTKACGLRLTATRAFSTKARYPPLKERVPTVQDKPPRLCRDVYAVAGGLSIAAKARPDCTPAREQLLEAVRMLFQDNDLKIDGPSDLKHYSGIVHSSYFADHFEGQLLMGAIAQDSIGWNPTGGWRIEAGGATGGCAVQAACLSVASGAYDYSLVLGWEKMSQVATQQGTEFIALASDTDFDFEAGGNYTGYYAAMAQEHIGTFGTNRLQMAKVAVKNRNQAQYNPFAQTCHKNPFATQNTSGFINARQVIGDERPSCSPLHVLDCCTMSDAASSILICSKELAYALTDHPIRLAGLGNGTDSMRTGDRERSLGSLMRPGVFFPDRSMLLPHEDTPEIRAMYDKIRYPHAHSFLAGRQAAIEAYRMAGIKDPRKEISWLETHDAFTSSEIQAIEDFGMAPYGQGGKFIDSAPWDSEKAVFKEKFPKFGLTENKCYLTLSGGLIGARHGVGDTGVFQNIDTMWRLQGKINKFYGPEALQPDVKGGTKAADHSHAGTGAYVTVSIWERPEGLPKYILPEGQEYVCDKVYRNIETQRKNAATGIRKAGVPKNHTDLIHPDHKTLGMRYNNSAGSSIIHNPYHIDYYHTRGRVSPFFDNLGKGKLLATYCPEHGVYMAPVAYCRVSDCLEDLSENWCDLAKTPARVQTWTSMHYAGPTFANDLPFHNILVEFGDEECNVSGLKDEVTGKLLPSMKMKTSFMSRLKMPDWMKETEIFTGMKIRAVFNTSNPAGRMKDVWFEPAYTRDEWASVLKTVSEKCKGAASDRFMEGIH